MADPLLSQIRRAQVYDVARRTPLDPAPRLSSQLGARVFLKREDLQPVFSFKIRGAYNKIVQLDPVVGRKGLIAASAGNHAQGVALGGTKLGFPTTIVMPRTTGSIKVDAVRALGGTVVLHGDTYDEALAEALRLAEVGDATFVHAYDDEAVMAGQGTIGLEVLEQLEEPPHAVFVPVGGGGLIAGVAAIVKDLSPDTRIVGVEPEDAACLKAALAAGHPVDLERVGIFADGAAVRRVGTQPFEVVRDLIDDLVTVSVDEICAGIQDLFQDTRAIAEPAGALATAGMKKWVRSRSDRKGDESPVDDGPVLVAIQSGANMNFHRLRHVSERAEVGTTREGLFAVTIPEENGSFRALCSALEDRPVTEFNYRYSGGDEAHVFVGLQLKGGAEEREKILQLLAVAGFPVVDLTGNEVAVLHTRHMVGGRSPQLTGERMFRFEFPERPGALRRFLNLMSPAWAITLFHYRNHGAAHGRVLAGIAVPSGDEEAFDAYLEALAYPVIEETHNEAYRLFLR